VEVGRIAVCIPTYNEKENILAIIKAVHAELPDAAIMIVDGNSPDGTAEMVENFSKDNPFVSIKIRRGKDSLGMSYIDGFQTLIEKGFEKIIQMDADFSHKPEYLREMVKKSDEGFQVVAGSRYVKGGGTANWGIVRRVISSCGSLYANMILNLGIHDVTAGFKCWDAEFLKKTISTPIVIPGFGFQIEMAFRTKICGGKVFELPIIFPGRTEGTSKMNWKIFKEALFGVWKLKFTGRKIVEN